MLEGIEGDVYYKLEALAGNNQKIVWGVHSEDMTLVSAEKAGAQLSKVATPSQPALIFPNSGDTINEADIDSLEDIVKAIYDGSVSVQVASRYGYRFGDLAVEHCKFSHVAGEFLIFRLTAVGDGQLEFAMRRDPVLEREEAITNLIEGGEEDLIVGGKALALGAIRVTGVEQFTTANGLVKVIPIVTFVP